jgi:hypothetical protein
LKVKKPQRNHTAQAWLLAMSLGVMPVRAKPVLAPKDSALAMNPRLLTYKLARDAPPQ